MSTVTTSQRLGSITLKQVELLEEIFATRTPAGWDIPDWLVTLRREVEPRHYVPQYVRPHTEWLLLNTWNHEHATFYAQQTEVIFPRYYPSTHEADDAFAMLMGCPL